MQYAYVTVGHARHDLHEHGAHTAADQGEVRRDGGFAHHDGGELRDDQVDEKG